MCGFAAVIKSPCEATQPDPGARLAMVGVLKAILRTFVHRGDPECSEEVHAAETFALGTNRLAIVDRQFGKQPVSVADGRVWVAFNGEIYNHKVLHDELVDCGRTFLTQSDTEVIAVGYLEWGLGVLDRLDGIFGFIIIDTKNNTFVAARDHVGIKPLYYVEADATYYFASEQKGLLSVSNQIRTLDPGCFLQDGKVGRYFDIDTVKSVRSFCDSKEDQIARCRDLLTRAVRKQCQTDLPLAVMFSGGIDSSIVLHLARQFHDNVTAFTIGLEGATDVPFAERYCIEHGIPHKVYKLTPEELTSMLPTIASNAEFFEGIDAIDACVAYFGYRLARQNGFKIALCGEGSDEVFAGYDLFKNHPDPDALKQYRVHNLHRTDLQRVDRASMLNSVEARVPFLDRELLEFAYHLPMSMKLKGGVEKWVLREAFRNDLPDYLIDRPKVRMPEGSGVKNILMDFAAAQMKDNPIIVPSDISLDTPQAQYFYSLYVKAGYCPPLERHRLPGMDYSENGYFAFTS